MSSSDSEIEDKFVDLNISETKNEETVFNILLLGETGVGKSTFINSFANYLTYKQIDIAEKNELIVLIPSRFTIIDKNKKEHKIHVGSDRDENEFLETGESATQGVKTYTFPIWKNKSKVRIIDTPGLGDTRGIEFDERNYDNVLKYVGSLDYLHAICFLMKPTEARRTLFFEYCFSQLLCRLDKPACNKMFFLFTKTRGTNYTANTTTSILETIFSEIKKYTPDVNIPLNKNVFCFDNEVFRYLAAKQQNVEFSQEEINNYKMSWNKSYTNVWNLLNDVRNSNQISYSPKIVTDITNARNVMGCFAKVMLRISELINNDAGLKTLIENRDSVSAELEELRTREKISATVVFKKYQSKPLLVCAANCCIDIYKNGTETQKHYKTVCHWECEEAYSADKEVIGHPQLVNCFAINAQTRLCSSCKCDFSAHLLVDYQTMLKEDSVLDPDVTKQINNKESLLRSSLDVISDLQRKHYELKEEREQIKDICNKLACFIRKMAIIPFNHSYGEYVEQCIKREQSSLRSNKSVESLRKLLQENEELRKIFEDALLTDEAVSLIDSDCSFEEIRERYQQLFGLKYNGKFIRELLIRDDILIDNDQTIPEYVHTVKFKHKKERKSKDKKKEKGDGDKKSDKKKKEKADVEDGKENYESDASFKSEVSSKSEVKERKHRKNKTKPDSNDQNKEENKQSKGRYKSNKSNKNTHGNGERCKSDNVPSSRDPPPPYSHIWTPSEGSKTFNQQPYSDFHYDENADNGKNVTKSKDTTFDKYEIRVSVKEKVNNQPFYDDNNYSRFNSSAYPPSRYSTDNPYDQQYSYPDFSNYPRGPSSNPRGPLLNPRGPLPNPRGPPPNPRGPPHNPSGPTPNLRYPPPNPRYPPHQQSYPLPNMNYPASHPRYPQPYPRYPSPVPGFPSSDPRFPPPYERFPSSNSVPGYDTGYHQRQGIIPPSHPHKTRVVHHGKPNHSHKSKGGQENDKKHENKIKNDGHIKKAKDSIKQGKSNKESSSGEKTHKKKNKDDKKDEKKEI